MRSMVEGALHEGIAQSNSPSTAFGGPQFQVGRAPGTTLNCRGQFNLKLVPGRIFAPRQSGRSVQKLTPMGPVRRPPHNFAPVLRLIANRRPAPVKSQAPD